MTPSQPKKESGTLQKNANTIMISVILALSGWTLKGVIELKIQSATDHQQIMTNTSSIKEITRSMNDKTTVTEKIDIRLSRLETIQEQTKNK